ncbi:EamA domain-containing protein [Entamoeba marina]
MTQKILAKIHFNKSNVVLVLLFILLLGFGTVGAVISKTVYLIESPNKNGELQKFERPMYYNLLMFIGMFLLIFGYFIEVIINYFKKLIKKHKLQGYDESIQGNSNENVQKTKISFKQYFLIFIATVCDFLTSYLTSFGLLFVPLSINQMMRGSIIIFSMIFAIFWRKQKQYAYNFVGVAFIVIALIVVGSSMFIPTGNEDTPDENDDEQAWYLYIVGIVLIISSQFLSALDSVLQEMLFKDLKAPITFLTGLKGFYGIILCLVTLGSFYFMTFLPEVIREDIVDTFYMLKNSYTLIILSCCYIFIILFFNYIGAIVIQKFSAMMRNIMDPTRMVTVWIASIIIHYVISDEFGEAISYASIVEVFGFGLLLIGFGLYTKFIKLPFIFKYETSTSEFTEIEASTIEMVPNSDTPSVITTIIDNEITNENGIEELEANDIAIVKDEMN